MYNVLIVCTGNICRSPMAAGLLAHSLPPSIANRIAVASSGTHALHGHHAEPHGVEAMAQIGINIQNHRARQIDRQITRNADLILTMESAHTKEVKRLTKWLQPPPRLISEFNPLTDNHDIKDPYGGPLKAYQNCLWTLRPCVEGVILWLEDNL